MKQSSSLPRRTAAFRSALRFPKGVGLVWGRGTLRHPTPKPGLGQRRPTHAAYGRTVRSTDERWRAPQSIPPRPIWRPMHPGRRYLWAGRRVPKFSSERNEDQREHARRRAASLPTTLIPRAQRTPLQLRVDADCTVERRPSHLALVHLSWPAGSLFSLLVRGRFCRGDPQPK